MDQLDSPETQTERPLRQEDREREWEKVQGHSYRDLVALKLVENHEKLEKLIWTMQDALDQVASETQRQGDCLYEIEDLFEAVRRSNVP